MLKQKAFSLAEVLITMGIIGVVAALTLPNLIANHRKVEVSARLQKFNTIMQQAILDSERENGMYEDWPIANTGGAMNQPEPFFNKYLRPYLRVASTKTDSEWYVVELEDGTSFGIYRGGCYDFIFDTNGNKIGPNEEGSDRFRFVMCQTSTALCVNPSSPWCSYGSTNDRAQALSDCKTNRAHCSRLLELEEWKIPDDYPYEI